MSKNSAHAQCKRIETRLRQNSANTIELMDELDIMRPSARIAELRKRGLNIVTHWTNDTMPNGGKHRCAKYVLLPGAYKGGAA